jgi:hypothetical protein
VSPQARLISDESFDIGSWQRMSTTFPFTLLERHILSQREFAFLKKTPDGPKDLQILTAD